MKKIKFSIIIMGLMMLAITSCSEDNNNPIQNPDEPTKPKEEATKGEETLAEKLKGTYKSTMVSVVRDGQTKGRNLKLYCFVVPTETNAKDSVSIEVRNWSGDFMPHLLTFRCVVKVEENKEKKGTYNMIFPEIGGKIPYEVQGIKGVDKKGNVTGTFSIDKEGVPSFNCNFFVFKYTMEIKSDELVSKTVLPNANSSL